MSSASAGTTCTCAGGSSLPAGISWGNAGRGVAAGRGMSWIGEAWDLFKRSPGLWIGMVLVLFV
ncbi:MAG: hypothetical protein WD845_00710, partial [Pirellulales bacterium]